MEPPLRWKDLMDEEYFDYWMDVCDYGVNDSAELLAKIKAFEESKDIWAITDIRVSSFFESFILGHLNDQHSLELNKLGFAFRQRGHALAV
jgi:hypothetical protein